MTNDERNRAVRLRHKLNKLGYTMMKMNCRRDSIDNFGGYAIIFSLLFGRLACCNTLGGFFVFISQPGGYRAAVAARCRPSMRLNWTN